MMSKEDAENDRYYKATVELYKDEHRRWNQWALFFFGALASTFIAWNTLKDDGIPLWFPAIIAAIICLLWTFSAQAIRRSNKAWQETIIEVEQNNTKPFTTHAKIIQDFGHWNDLKETVLFVECFSIGRNLVRLGILAMLACLALAAWDYCKRVDGWLNLWAAFTTLLSVVAIVWAVGVTVKLRKVQKINQSEEISENQSDTESANKELL